MYIYTYIYKTLRARKFANVQGLTKTLGKQTQGRLLRLASRTSTATVKALEIENTGIFWFSSLLRPLAWALDPPSFPPPPLAPLSAVPRHNIESVLCTVVSLCSV